MAWEIINGVLTETNPPPDPVPTLAEKKARKLAALVTKYSQKIADGFSYGGHTYQLGPDKLGSSGVFNITAKGSSAKVSVDHPTGYPWPEGFKFYDAANVGVDMTAAEMLAFAKAADQYVTDLRLHYWSLRASIAAAADDTVLDAIDINAGWP